MSTHSSSSHSQSKKRLSSGLRRAAREEYEDGEDYPVRRKRKPKRKSRFLLWTFVLMIGLVAAAPRIISMTPLRNTLLEYALKDIKGSVTSRSATFGWLVPVQMEGFEIRDEKGASVVNLDKLESSLSLWQFVTNPTDLGTFKINKPVVQLAARNDGSNLEDILAPLLNQPKTEPSAPRTMRIEVTDGKISLLDAATNKTWTIDQFQFALTKQHDMPLPTNWSAAGKIPLGAQTASFQASTSVAAAGQAAAPNAIAPQVIQLKTDSLPLEMFRVAIARFMGDVQVSGTLQADAKLETRNELNGVSQTLTGVISASQLSVLGGMIGGDHISLNSVSVPCDLTLHTDRVDVRSLQLKCDLGEMTASGSVPLDAKTNLTDPVTLMRQNLKASGKFDLSALARQLPTTLAINPETKLTGGTLEFNWNSQLDPQNQRVLGGFVEARGITANYQNSPVTWQDPVRVEFAARDSSAGPVIEKLQASSRFLQMQGAGTLDKMEIDMNCDLDQVAAELGKLINLKSYELAGKINAKLNWERVQDNRFTTTLNGVLREVKARMSPQVMLHEPELTISSKANGRISGTSLEKIEAAEIVVSAPLKQGATVADELKVSLVGPVNIPTSPAGTIGAKNSPSPWSQMNLPLSHSLKGDLTAWHARLATILPIKNFQMGGTVNLSGQTQGTMSNISIPLFTGSVNNLVVLGPGLNIQEQRPASIKLIGNIDLDHAAMTLKDSTIETETIAIRADSLELGWAANAPLSLRGVVVYGANINRLQQVFGDPTKPASMLFIGLLQGQANIVANGSQNKIDCENTIGQFAAFDTKAIADYQNAAQAAAKSGTAAPAQPGPLWSEPDLKVSLHGAYDTARDALSIETVQLISQALGIRASGKMDQATSTKAMFSLNGKLDYDWKTLSPILKPYVGDKVKIEGRESREFSLQGPLSVVTDPKQIAAINASIKSVKEDVANAADNAVVQASFNAPTSGASMSQANSLGWIKPLTGKAAMGWEKAEAFGFNIGKGVIDVEMREGLATVKPLDLVVEEGKVYLAPQVNITQDPMVLILPAGKAIEKVRVTPKIANEMLSYITPYAANAAAIDGHFSLELAQTGGRIPLSQPLAADISGRIQLHGLNIAPGESLNGLVLLIQQVKALKNMQIPSTTLDAANRPTLKIKEQQVEFRVVDGKVYHQGLQIQIGDVNATSQGWVSMKDRTMGMSIEIPIQQDWIAKAPLLGKIPGQKITIPVGGTVEGQQYDMSSIKQLATNYLQGAAQDFLQNNTGKAQDFIQNKLSNPVEKGQQNLQEQINSGTDKLNKQLENGLNKLFK